MNRLTSISISFLLSFSAFAIPAKRTPFTVYQSDSTALTVVLKGDESFHYLTTTDGIPVVEDGDGFYRLAPELQEQMSETWTAKSRLRNAHRRERAAVQAKARRVGGVDGISYIGDKKGIVILVNFSNLSMLTPKESFYNQFNQTGYNVNGHIGSVHDYFYDQSYGKFNLTFDVYGPVTMNKGYNYYGANDRNGEDLHVGELARDACIMANSAYNIDWSKYDWDGDGTVDQVYLIYAGYGEAAGAPSNTIWPHEWELESADGKGPVTFNGIRVNTYAMSNELNGTSGSTIDGIGTACHEFSHCLGLPDFYDTSGGTAFGMDSWDLMDYGCYGGPTGEGTIPTGFTAYERWYAGWLTPVELSTPYSVTNMPALQDEPVAYILYNDAHPDEFFMLENRQARGWFSYVNYFSGIHGILALHGNYVEDDWYENAVNNNSSAQGMTIIPACRSYNHSYASHVFPGTKGVTALTNTSHSAWGGRLLNKNTDGTYYMNKPITNIKETKGLISFDFMGGTPSGIDVVETDGNAMVEYFTLSGARVAAPTTPGIYLKRQNGITQKIYHP